MPRKARRPSAPTDPIDAALALAAERSWRMVSLADIAARAQLPLASLLERHPSKTALLLGFARRIDQAMLEATDASLEGRPAQERLFDVVMRRLDALAPHKDALRSIARGGSCDFEALVCGGLSFRRSLSLMLEAAGLSSSGPFGALRRKGLALVYLDTLRVWMRDDSPDMAATMKALDGHLRRIANLIERVKGWRGRARGGQDEAAGGRASS